MISGINKKVRYDLEKGNSYAVLAPDNFASNIEEAIKRAEHIIEVKNN